MASNEPPDPIALNDTLIGRLKEKDCLHDERVEAAFRAVLRHHFLPDLDLAEVYSDRAIPTKSIDGGEAISSSSQPAIMAIMLEQLQIEPGHRILEIGAGTGYNAALMAHLVGETGGVVALDLDEDTVEEAQQHLAAAAARRVHVVCRDGVAGFSEAAPFDRIILTVGAWDIAPAWWEQLKPDGRLVLPLTISGHDTKSVAFLKRSGPDGDYLVSDSAAPCGFMPLRGQMAAQRPFKTLSIGPEPGLVFRYETPQTVEGDTIYDWLTGPGQDWPTRTRIEPKQNWFGWLWAGLHETGFCSLTANPSYDDKDIVPPLYGDADSWRATIGILGNDGLAFLMTSPDQPPRWEQSDTSSPFSLYVRSFGPDDTPARRLVSLMNAWADADYPPETDITLYAYPKSTPYQPTPTDHVIKKQWTRLVIDWPKKKR